jgi:hypothetical protein
VSSVASPSSGPGKRIGSSISTPPYLCQLDPTRKGERRASIRPSRRLSTKGPRRTRRPTQPLMRLTG